MGVGALVRKGAHAACTEVRTAEGKKEERKLSITSSETLQTHILVLINKKSVNMLTCEGWPLLAG